MLHLFSAVKKSASFKMNHTQFAGSKVPSLYIETNNPFTEIEKFVDSSARLYHLDLYKAKGPMKQGLAQFLLNNPKIKAILIGTRRTDPHGGGLSSFTPTSEDWPKAMRVYPILDWDYKTVWSLLRTLNVPYCSLYDQGYTSLGDRNNTLPNPLLRNDSLACGYEPAWKLQNESSEREGRILKR